MKEEIKNYKRGTYWLLVVIIAIVLYKLLDNFGDITSWIGNLFSVLAPFFSGILIAYLLYLPSKKIEKGLKKTKNKYFAKRARRYSILITYVIAILIVLILINFILPVIIESIIELVNNFQNYYTVALMRYNELPDDSALKTEAVANIVNSFQNINLKDYINVENLAGYAKGAINIVTSLFDVFVALIVSVYVLAERTEILKFVKKLANAVFEEKTYNNLGKYFDSTNQIFFKFLVSQLLDAVVVGILTTIGMLIIGVKYAPLLGFMIGLFNIIPYFGAIIAVAIAAVITLITGGLSQAIIMLIVVIILQQIDANIINPKIVGNSLKISPLLVIFAVTLGGAYFGVLGMFLAVPVIAVIKIIINDYIDFKVKSKKKDVDEDID